MTDSYDNFVCDSCSAVFGVITNIQAGGRVVRTLDPTRDLFDGKCPACGCTHLSLDPDPDPDEEDETEEANNNNDAYRKTKY